MLRPRSDSSTCRSLVSLQPRVRTHRRTDLLRVHWYSAVNLELWVDSVATHAQASAWMNTLLCLFSYRSNRVASLVSAGATTTTCWGPGSMWSCACKPSTTNCIAKMVHVCCQIRTRCPSKDGAGAMKDRANVANPKERKFPRDDLGNTCLSLGVCVGEQCRVARWLILWHAVLTTKLRYNIINLATMKLNCVFRRTNLQVCVAIYRDMHMKVVESDGQFNKNR